MALKAWLRWSVPLALFAMPMIAQGGVNRYYDRFKNQTEISASKGSVQAGGPLNLLWIAIVPGMDGVKSRPAAILDVSSSSFEGSQYMRCHELNFLADGKPVPVMLPNDYDGQVHGTAVIERVSTSIPPTTLDILAASSKVEMRLCRTEYTFDAADMENLREFAKAITPP